MIINHNIAALNTHRQLGANNTNASKNLEKLSSGLQINRAGDDAAGLAISEKMRGQIRGLDMAQKNAQDGISLIQTAEGALNETHDILQRMRELAVQSSNDTNTDTDRAELQNEVDALAQELTRIADNTEFNTQNLLNGDFKATFHIGANESQNLSISIDNMGAAALGVQNDTSGLQLEVTGKIESTDTKDLSGLGSVADGTSYDVVKLDKEITVDGVTANYAMQNADGEIVGLSETGKEWTLAETAEKDIADFTASLAAGIDMGDKVTSGKITVSDLTTTGTDDTITLTGIGTAEFAEGSKGLTSGEYTVVSDSNVFVASGDVGLINAKGDLVATSSDGEEWTDLNGDALLTTSVALTSGKTFTVAGEGGIDISSQGAADKAITTIQSAIDTVSAERSKLGAVQNRLEHTINNLGTSSENLTAAESRIRDVDYVLTAA